MTKEEAGESASCRIPTMSWFRASKNADVRNCVMSGNLTSGLSFASNGLAHFLYT